jgi:hypothetical protein
MQIPAAYADFCGPGILFQIASLAVASRQAGSGKLYYTKVG